MITALVEQDQAAVALNRKPFRIAIDQPPFARGSWGRDRLEILVGDRAGFGPHNAEEFAGEVLRWRHYPACLITGGTPWAETVNAFRRHRFHAGDGPLI